MTHIALLGDSVIDNKAYVNGGPDVADQVKMLVPAQWSVTRLALDGAVLAGVVRQLEKVPTDVTHLVISAGGNDALGQSGILDSPASSVADVLNRLAGVQDGFRKGYSQMLDAAARRKRPVAVCTIYDPRFPDRVQRRLSSLALSVLNDVITREAFARGFAVIDLRIMFDDDRDFANPIEPSVQGGSKLASAIQRFASGQSDSFVIR
jgi:hypothetical protein